MELLNKPGQAGRDEWAVLRAHPAAGAALAAPLLDWLTPMHLVIEEHHERWDGGGYPAGKRASSSASGRGSCRSPTASRS